MYLINNYMTIAQFQRETSNRTLWNTIKQVGNKKIASVRWHDLPWKVVDTLDFKTVSEREYKPIAEFRTREELWKSIKDSI
jgi:hypothetical protein